MLSSINTTSSQTSRTPLAGYNSNIIKASALADLEVIKVPIKVLDKVANMAHHKLIVKKAVTGGPLLSAKVLHRKVSKTRSPVQKAVRDCKGNNPLLKLRMKAEQRKASQTNIQLQGSISSVASSNDGAHDTIPLLEDVRPRHDDQQHRQDFTFEHAQPYLIDTPSDSDVEMVDADSLRVSSTTSIQGDDITQDPVSEKVPDICDKLIPQITDIVFTKDSTSEIGNSTHITIHDEGIVEQCQLSVTIDTLITPATSTALLTLPLRKQFPSPLTGEQLSQLIALYVTPLRAISTAPPVSVSHFDLSELLDDSLLIAAMFKEVCVTPAPQKIVTVHETVLQNIAKAPSAASVLTLTSSTMQTHVSTNVKSSRIVCNAPHKHKCANSWGQCCYARFSLPAELNPSLPKTGSLPVVDPSMPISLAPASVAAIIPNGSSRDTIKVLAMQNTFLGSASLADLIETIEFDKNGITTKKNLVVAFFKLASNGRLVMGPYYVPLTLKVVTTEHKSPVIQQRITLGGISVFDLIVDIHSLFDLQWRVPVLEVAEGFRRLATKDLTVSAKIASFLKLEADADG